MARSSDVDFLSRLCGGEEQTRWFVWLHIFLSRLCGGEGLSAAQRWIIGSSGVSKFVEHNNRAKAKKFAEYITGQELRQYLAQKVKSYCGNNPTVFDGRVVAVNLSNSLSLSCYMA